MADNTAVTPGAGDVIRDRDRGGVKTQVFGLDVGIGGAVEQLMSPTNPAPVALRDPVTARTHRISSFGSLHAAPMHGLVNSTFFTSAALTSNYNIATGTAGTGATSANATDGFFTQTTGATAGSTAQMVSNDLAAYNGIGPLLFLDGLRLGQAGVAGVVRRWGMFSTDGANGYFFEDRDGILGVVARKNGLDTRVASAAFNGTVTPADTNAHVWEIEVTGGRTVFSQDGVMLHTVVPAAGATTTSASLIFVIRVDSANGANAAAFTMEGRGQNIARIGTIDSKRLNEPIPDAQDADLVRAVMTLRLAADSYATPSGTAAGSKTGLDVNLVSSQSGLTATAATITAADVTAGGVANTTGAVVANVAPAGNVTASITTSAFVGTLIFEVSDDNGVSFYSYQMARDDGSGADVTLAVSTAALLKRIWTNGVGGGITHFRVRASVFTSGSVAVRVSPGVQLIDATPSLGAGASVIGQVGQAWGTAGRTSLALTANAPNAALAGVAATETLLPLQYTKALGAAVTAVTSYQVAAGKTLRLQEISLTARATVATATAITVSVRATAPGVGVVGVASPVLWSGTISVPATITATSPPLVIALPDGLELPAGANIGITYLQTTASVIALGANVTGFEY